MKRYLAIVWAIALIVCIGCAHYNKPPVDQPTNSGERVTSVKPHSSTHMKQEPKSGHKHSANDPKPLTLPELHEKYREVFVLSGPSNKREVALTFDDAPDDKFTPQVLDILKKEKVKATFFVVGNRVQAHPKIMKRIIDEGHAIGNHSYNHANLPKLSDAAFRTQITKTDKLIRDYAGYTPKIVRPPYGNINESEIRWLNKQHKKVVNWDVDSLDWKGLNAKKVTTNVLTHVRPGSIILQHSGGGAGEDLSGTVDALPRIIHQLKKNKMTFVTIPKMFGLLKDA